MGFWKKLLGGLVVALVGVFGGVWIVLSMPGQSWSDPLPPLTEAERARVDVLRHHVEVLAKDIGERNIHYAPRSLERAEDYVEAAFSELGYAVQREAFTPEGEAMEVANLVAELGDGDEIVVVGAHYDSAPSTPGADDNATGVAALLVLADELREVDLARTVRFVAFTNEEPPWFHGPDMGSRHHARNARARDEPVVAMLSLETLGYYRDAPGTQHYPQPFGLLYPNTGDFVGFIGNLESRSLVHRTVGIFREHARFPSEGATLPESVPGVGWSDHRSFWEQGYPAVMVTDTAPNRNPHYHEPSDRPEELDFDRLSRVVTGLVAVVSDLAGPGPG